MEIPLILVGKIACAVLVAVGNVGTVVLMQKDAERKVDKTIEKRLAEKEKKN